MDTFLKYIQERTSEIVGKANTELQGIRSNRPSVAMVEEVPVEAYDQQLKVKEVASLSIRPPREIEVSVWDKSIIGIVTKAIEANKSGFSVVNDGTAIRVILPPLTDERREELARMVKKLAESFRIEIRNAREDVLKRVRSAEDAKELSEDQAYKGKEQVQKVIDSANQKIEQMLSAKLAELQE